MIEQYPRLVAQGLSWPSTPMTGFVVGSNKYAVSEYSNLEIMEKTYKVSYKALFNLAVRRALSNVTQSNSPETGSIHKLKYGITIDRIFSLIIESLLGLVALLSLALLWRCAVAKAKLVEDPATIASLMEIIKNSEQFLVDFSGKGTLNDEALKNALKNHVFRFRCGCESRSGTMVIEVLNARDARFERIRENSKPEDGSQNRGSYRPITPTALRKDIGLIFSLCLMAMIAGLVYLKLQEQKLKGKMTYLYLVHDYFRC